MGSLGAAFLEKTRMLVVTDMGRFHSHCPLQHDDRNAPCFHIVVDVNVSLACGVRSSGAFCRSRLLAIWNWPVHT